MAFCAPTIFRSSIPDALAIFLPGCRASLTLVALVGIMAAATLAAHEVAEPEGYRTSDYLSPVPMTLKGATTLDARTLHESLTDCANMVLIDVLPLRRKPPDFPPDRFWRTPPRYNIPGSVWLPNVGYGDIAPEFESYFIENLGKLTSGQTQDKPVNLVFYCLEDCWMSWNAAKRALELGYRNVFWFPGGTDEWEIMGYELERSLPVKMPDFASAKASHEL